MYRREGGDKYFICYRKAHCASILHGRWALYKLLSLFVTDRIFCIIFGVIVCMCVFCMFVYVCERILYSITILMMRIHDVTCKEWYLCETVYCQLEGE